MEKCVLCFTGIGCEEHNQPATEQGIGGGKLTLNIIEEKASEPTQSAEKLADIEREVLEANCEE